ncbi:hypothetical protein G5I_10530 [Acromyrmex echinatior]|uniref:Uncharacterized protein n=1 Tax=Acromyrmex echinatior TaxID=103372 RepID=F4WX39_ACREC|nr:hypothetical protein G5I_10530 [Acromyrmex echinatior]
MSRTSNPAEVLEKQSSSNYHWYDKIPASVSDMRNLLNKRMFKVCFWDEHKTTKKAELRINGMRRINHWGDLLDCDDVKFLSGQLLTNRGLCEARAAIRSYSTREREADVGETQCGANYYQCNGAAAVRLSPPLEKRFRFIRSSKRTPLTTRYWKLNSRDESKQIKGILSGCSARQKTFEVGKVCSICTYYGSLFSLVEQPSKVLVHPRVKRDRTCFDERRRHGTRWSIRLIHEPKKAARECPPQTAKHSRKFTVPNGISMLDRRVLNLQLTLWKTINHKFLSFSAANIIMNFLHEKHSRCVPLQDVTLRNISRKEGYAPKQLLRF